MRSNVCLSSTHKLCNRSPRTDLMTALKNPHNLSVEKELDMLQRYHKMEGRENEASCKKKNNNKFCQ